MLRVRGRLIFQKLRKERCRTYLKKKLGKKRKQTIMTPEELNTLIRSRKVDSSRAISRVKFAFNQQSGEDIVKQLQEATLGKT